MKLIYNMSRKLPQKEFIMKFLDIHSEDRFLSTEPISTGPISGGPISGEPISAEPISARPTSRQTDLLREAHRLWGCDDDTLTGYNNNAPTGANKGGQDERTV